MLFFNKILTFQKEVFEEMSRSKNASVLKNNHGHQLHYLFYNNGVHLIVSLKFYKKDTDIWVNRYHFLNCFQLILY